MFARLFGPRLRTLREERGLTQREFAQRIGAMVGQVCRYERGQALPAAETIVAMTEVLGVDFNTLLGVETAVPPAPDLRDIPLLERFRELQRLAKPDRDALLRIVDAVIKSHQHETVERRHFTPRVARG